jgi:hypothetical protein
MTQLIQRETRTGEPITVGERTVRTQSQFVMVRFPFGGFVWNRPTAVLVTENNHNYTIPITDPTRLALWTLTGMSVIGSLWVWPGRRR